MAKIIEVVRPPKKFNYTIIKHVNPNEFEEREWFNWIKDNLIKDIFYRKTIFYNHQGNDIYYEYQIWFLSSDDSFLYKLRWD